MRLPFSCPSRAGVLPLLLAFFMALAGGAALAQAAAPASVDSARTAFAEALKHLRQVEQLLAKAETESRRADDEVTYAPTAAVLKQRAAAAVVSNQRVLDLEAERADARRTLADARLKLQVAAAVLPEPAASAPLTVAQRGAATALVEAASKASETVATLQSNSQKAFQATDEASAVALRMAQAAIKDGSGPDSDAGKNALKTIKLADEAREKALSVHDQHSKVQSLANRLVGAGSQLAECSLGSDCASFPSLAEQADAAATELKRRADSSKEDFATAKLLSFGVKANEMGDNDTERAAALKFLELADRNPNAKGLFGGEAATVTAGKDGAEAAIRMSFKRLVSSWAEDTALTLSAPLGKGGDTRFLSSEGKRMPDDVTLGVETNLMRNFVLRHNTLPVYNQWNVFGKVGRQTFKVANADLLTPAQSAGKTHLSAGIGTLWGFEKLEAVHRLSIKRDLSYEADDESTRCLPKPIKVKDPVTKLDTDQDETYLRCATGSFAAPSRTWSTEATYSYRREFKGFGIAPAVSYSFGDKLKTYDLPIYLIRGLGDDKTKFTAGVSYHLESKPGSSNKQRWELFLTSPLSVLGQ